jgi:hypothetical protein
MSHFKGNFEGAIIGDTLEGFIPWEFMGAGNHLYECVPCMLPYLENWQSWVCSACLKTEKLAMIGILYMPLYLENWRTLKAGNHGSTHRYRVQNMLPYLGNWQSWGCPACFRTWRTGNHGNALHASVPGELAIMGMPCMLPYLENWQPWGCPACFLTGNHGDALHASVPGELVIMGMPCMLPYLVNWQS